MTGNEIATFEEAINFIENKVQIDVRFCTDEEVKTTIEVFNLACVALRKQIPKKAIDDGLQFAICPECGASVNKDIEQVYNGETSYCVCCGQALDWSDT